MNHALMMLGAMAIDTRFGWPEALYRTIGHPVTWLGRVIASLERRLNRGSRPRRIVSGALCCVVTLGLAGLPACALQAALPDSLGGALIGAVVAWPLVALRSMHDHVAAVARPLAGNDLPGARQAVSMIVGRDPARLDAAGVARAATESLAENTSDGIVAPLFWGVVAGLPGIALYKAINTMDSMIGHRNDRFEAFGKVAARLDDVANLVPARLTGLLFTIAARRPGHVLRIMWRDARRHRSPNAGWPESAMAAALGVRLSGPRVYGDHVSAEPWLNADAPDPTAKDVSRALGLFRRAMGLGALALAAAMLLG